MRVVDRGRYADRLAAVGAFDLYDVVVIIFVIVVEIEVIVLVVIVVILILVVFVIAVEVFLRVAEILVDLFNVIVQTVALVLKRGHAVGNVLKHTDYLGKEPSLVAFAVDLHAFGKTFKISYFFTQRHNSLPPLAAKLTALLFQDIRRSSYLFSERRLRL